MSNIDITRTIKQQTRFLFIPIMLACLQFYLLWLLLRDFEMEAIPAICLVGTILLFALRKLIRVILLHTNKFQVIPYKCTAVTGYTQKGYTYFRVIGTNPTTNKQKCFMVSKDFYKEIAANDSFSIIDFNNRLLGHVIINDSIVKH